jgi:hypothetical protein
MAGEDQNDARVMANNNSELVTGSVTGDPAWFSRSAGARNLLKG